MVKWENKNIHKKKKKHTGLALVAVLKCEKGIRNFYLNTCMLYQVLTRQTLSAQNCMINPGFTAEIKYIMAQKYAFRFNEEK